MLFYSVTDRYVRKLASCQLLGAYHRQYVTQRGYILEKLTKQSIERLINSSEKPAVTIYIPMHTSASPPHVNENQIRLKNLCNRAIEQIEQYSNEGNTSQLIRKIKYYMEKARDENSFWQQQTPGLLICANSHSISEFQLPIDTEEYIAVDEQFHLAPVLALLQDAREFYVLTLAQHNPGLYKGDLYGLSTAEINLPSSIEQGLGIDEANRKTENQGSARGLSSDTSWFNGRGGARNPQEEDRMKFFRLIDDAVTSQLDNNLPLILAGTDSEVAEFKAISKYTKLTASHISGNHTETDEKTLFDRAINIIQTDIIEPEHNAALEEFSHLQGANPVKVANDIESIKTAAQQGRIDKLLVSAYKNTTDTVRDTLHSVLRITFPENADASKLLNSLSLTVWGMSGTVMNLAPEQIPGNRNMVARLRY